MAKDKQNLEIDARALRCGHTSYPFFESAPTFKFPFEINLGPRIERVIFNNPATVVFWTDGSKTGVKVGDGDEYDPEKGVLLAYMKKGFGNGYYRELKRKIADAQVEATA